jgi:fibronectin type III domain protein
MTDVLNTEIDKSARLALGWGRHPVQGYRIKHRVEMVGNQKTVFVKLGLGLDEWDACEGLYCKGVQIAPTDFVFHPGGTVDFADPFFPGELNPGATYITVRLTGAMADEANIDKIEGIYRTLKIANYNGAGQQIDVYGNLLPVGATPRNYFFYSPNPPRQMVDLILRWGLRPSTIVDWPGWAGWRDDCAELIPWTGGFVGVQPSALVWRDGGNMTAGAGGSISKTGGANGVWDAGTVTDNYIPINSSGYLRWTAGAGRFMCGLTPQQALVQPTYTGLTIGLYMEAGGVLKLFLGGTFGGNPIGTWVAGDVFEVGVSGGVWLLKKNGGAISTAGVTLPPVPNEQLHGAIAAYNVGSTVTAATFSPLAGGAVSETRMVPRFESHLFFMPPFRLSSDAMNKIAEVCCAEWQRANGKLYFLTPHARNPIFTFDLSKLPIGAFKTYPKDRRERFNQVIVYGRDLDTKFLTPFGDEGAAPLVDIKRDLAPGELRKPYEIHGGGMTASQASRVGEFWAATKCDDPRYAEIEGSPDSFPVLPADVVALSAVVSTWNGVKFKVVEKEESEDTKLGYPMTLELYKPGAYSDGAHGAVDRPLPVANPNQFAAPSQVTSVTLSERNDAEADNTVVTILIVDAQFAPYVNQDKGYKGRVFYKKKFQADGVTLTPDSDYKDAGVINPHPTTLMGSKEIRGVEKVAYQVKVVPESDFASAGISGATAYTWTIVGKTTAPVTPTGLNATLGDNGMIVWSVNASSDGDFSFMRVYDGAGNIVRSRVDATQWEEPPSAASVTRKVTFFNRSGIESAFSTPLTYTLPSPLLPTGYGVTFDFENSRILHRLTAVADVTYDFARANDGTNILTQDISGGVFDETNIPNTSRGAFTRYARARRFGMVSAWVAASPALSVTAPVAPTIAEVGGDVSRATPVSFPLKVTTTTPKSQIKTTVVQLRAAGGSWPVSTAQGTANVIRRNGAPEEVEILWNAGGAIELRVAHEDLFTPQIGDHVWSSLLAHTFPKFNDGAIDQTSNFVRKAAGRNGIIDGAGTIGWTSGFVVKWSLPIVISSGLSPTRLITIPANVSGQTLNQGHRLVARYTLGATTAAITDVDLSTYTEPDELSGTLDFPLFERRTGSNTLLTYLGEPLDTDRYLDSSVLIPRLSSFIADLKSVLIDDANINSVSATKIVVDVLYGRIIFAGTIGSTNFVSHGSQAAHSELVPWESSSITGATLDATSQTVTKTATGAIWGNASATLSRQVFYGDCAASIISDGASGGRIFGVSFGAITTHTDFEHAIYYGAAGVLYAYEGATATLLGYTHQAGDILKVEVVGATANYLRIRAGMSVVMRSVAASAKRPLRAGAAIYDIGAVVPQITLYGVLAPFTGTKIHPQNVIGISLDANDDLYKSGGSNATYDAGFSSGSGETIAANQSGGISFKAGASGTNKSFVQGLSTADSDQNYTSLLGGWAAGSDGNAYTYYNTVFTSFGAFTTSTLFQLAREGADLVWRLDGVEKKRIAGITTAQLIIDSSFYNTNAKVVSLRLFKAGAVGQGWQRTNYGPGEDNEGHLVRGVPTARTMASVMAVRDDGRFVGNDNGPVATHKIALMELKSWEILASGSGGAAVQVFNAIATATGVDKDDYANLDSAKWANLIIRNKFGEAALFVGEHSWHGKGSIGSGIMPVGYAHAQEEITLEATFYNVSGGDSTTVYASRGMWAGVSRGVVTQQPPPYLSRNDVPLDLRAAPLSTSSMRLSFRNPNNFSINVYYRLSEKDDTETWTQFGGTLPAGSTTVDVTGLSPDSEYEFTVERAGSAFYRSNIARRYTLAQGAAAPTYPAPTNLSGSPINATTAKWTWVVNATTNTDVEYSLNGGAWTSLGGAAVQTLSLTVAAGSSNTLKVRNKFAGPNYSVESNAETVTTPSANPSTLDPSNLSGRAISAYRIDLVWTQPSAGATVSIDWRLQGDASWTTITHPSLGASSYTHALTGITQDTSGRTYEYRVRNSTGANPSNETQVATPRIYAVDKYREDNAF